MLLRTTSLKGLPIQARDGQIGSVSDLLFEDDTWQIRWIVVDTGSWLFGRKVLLPSSELGTVEAGATSIAVDLTRKQVEDSPGAGTDLPVSRQMETSIYDYYGWAPYWSTTGLAYVPATAYPVVPAVPTPATPGAPTLGAVPTDAAADAAAGADRQGDPHLRSLDEIAGYYIHAADGDIGHVEDLMVDGGDWALRGFVVDTRNWWPGRTVVVPLDWVETLSWDERTVRLSRTRDDVKNAPEYDPDRLAQHTTGQSG